MNNLVEISILKTELQFKWHDFFLLSLWFQHTTHPEEKHFHHTFVTKQSPHQTCSHMAILPSPEMQDSVSILENQQQSQVPKYMLLPACVHRSRYSIRTKSCRYFELGWCWLIVGKNCCFYHNPQGPDSQQNWW